jgi:hypothetical protein
MHYSRVPRERWERRLELMRSGGIDVVSTYIPWIHHEPRRGEARFDGGLDLAAFVDLCRAGGFAVVLRIGPWVHGELRNGGFPDWVQASAVRHRTDDPAYLALVEQWFARIGAELDGPVLAIQLENELIDQPGHLVTLKRLARAAGMSAQLWTATAWDGARLPVGEVLPVYSGYGDGFWTDAGASWADEFREQYFLAPPAATPYVTCELAGGMATAYHRRPRPSALDVAAIAHNKIAGGSVWQGYYMYAGGTNPPGTQESHATGYPNDVPRLGYDFHAPIGEAGALSPIHAELRRQHAFLAAFADRLVGAPTVLPAERPTGVEDTTTLRQAVRGPFRFISWHQPHVPLGAVDGIPPGTLARWPLGLEVHGVRIDRATATALTVLDGTLVLCAHAGIPVDLVVGGEVLPVEPGRAPVVLPGLDVLVLTPDDAAQIWVHDDGRLLLCAADLGWGADGRIVAHAAVSPEVLVYVPAARSFRPLHLSGTAGSGSGVVKAVPLRPAGPVPAVYSLHGTRQSAPAPDEFDARAAVYRLDLPPWSGDALLHIDWAGDVAEVRVDGRAATDRFWDGSRWSLSLRDFGCTPGSTVTLHVLPLAAENPAHLPADARARRATVTGPLLAVDHVRIEQRRAWRE